MKSSLKKIKDCRVKMIVEVEPERVESRFREVFQDIQKVARIPGFREGKAPLELIEKKFSKEAHEEVLKSLIPEAYHQSVATQKVAPVTLPSISEIQMERGKKLTFSAEFEKMPEVQVKNYKGLKLKRESADVKEEDVEKGIQSLLESRADLVPLAELRAVQHGDFVVTDVEIWKGDQYVPGKKGILLRVEPGQNDNFYDQVIGANVNETREVKMPPDETPHYKIHIREIKEKKLPPLDEEFVKSFGKQTVEELREAVRKDLAGYKQSESLSKMKSELFEKLLAQVSFTPPEGLVEKQKEQLLEQSHRQFLQMGMPENRWQAEKEKSEKEASEKAQNQVKLYFILQKIAEHEDIHADEIEVEKRLVALAAESKRPLEEARKVFEDDLRESMRESKTVDFLIANAKFEETKA